MATKKTTKPATTEAPKSTTRTKAEVAAALERAKAKGREIDERQAAQADVAPKAAARVERKAKQVEPDAKPKRLSALDAAAKLLAETGESMTCQAMIETMSARGLWSSPNGQTPAATLYSAILRELARKGKDARFKKTDRGQFAAS